MKDGRRRSAYRFFHEGRLAPGDLVEIDYAKASGVLRLRRNDIVCVLDTDGKYHEARLEEIGPGILKALIGEDGFEGVGPEPVDLYLGILKGERMDLAVEKAAEAGAGSISPMTTERSVSGPGRERISRWRRKVVAAVLQSGRGRIPAVREPVSFEEALERIEFSPEDTGEVLLMLDPAGKNIREGGISPPVALFIGPEGGFSGREKRFFSSRGGTLASLGDGIFRTETAVGIGIWAISTDLKQKE